MGIIKAAKEKHRETSKIVLGSVLIFCGVLACFVMVGWFAGLDGAPSMMGVILGVSGVSIGFYAWKAKAENAIKLARAIDQSKGETETQKNILDAVAREQMPTGSSSGGGYYGGMY